MELGSGWRRWLPLVLLALAGLGLFASGIADYFSLDRLRQERELLLELVQRRPLLSALAFLVAYAMLVALSVPVAALMSLLAGFLFGLWLGTLLAVSAATIGATLVFLAARGPLGAAWRYRRAGLAQRLRVGFADNAFGYLLALRLIPQVPFFLVNLAAAFFNVPLRTYVITTAVGVAPAAAVIVGVGNGLGAVLEAGGTPDLAILWQPQVIGPLLGLAGLAVLPAAYKRWRGRRPPGVREP